MRASATSFALFLALAALPASAVAKPTGCGKVNAGFELSITASGGATCAKARAVVKAWHSQVAGKSGSPARIVHVGPFTCTGRHSGDIEHYAITCRVAGTKKAVAFVAGP